MSGIKADIILATRSDIDASNGLITFQVEVPLFVWTELLTHKRFARNASSARAQSTERYVGMGYYIPDTFYMKGDGMQSSDEPIPYQDAAIDIWISAWNAAVNYARQLTQAGIAKEQANRLIPPIKIIRGVVTGTEDAWKCFLQLRNHVTADKAMQEFARIVQSAIDNTIWSYSPFHVPFADKNEYGEVDVDQEVVKVAAARIARVSYDRPKQGKNDIELADMLLKDKHLSPFEHIAFAWPVTGIIASALNSKPEDQYGETVWLNYRSMIEITQGGR